MSTEEPEVRMADLDRLREELSNIMLAQVQALAEEVKRLREELQILKGRNERLESNARRRYLRDFAAELLGYSPGNDLSATHGRVRGEPR